MAAARQSERTVALSPRTAGFRGSIPLLILIAAGLLANFAQGIRLGQSGTLFYPMERSRQSLAVALSMMREPPPLGYQAYSAIDDLLRSRGLYVSDRDDDRLRRETLFRDSVAVNDTIAAALAVAVDPARQDEAIYANDLGYADFMHLAFVTFGAKLSSLYYLYFLLLAAGVAAFAVEFRNARVLLYGLSVYLSVHLFLLAYSSAHPAQIGSIANSRTFTGLALLPALHLACQLVADTPLRLRSAATAVVQAALLAFLLTCRFEAAWEVGFVVVVAGLISLFHVARTALQGSLISFRRLASLWPALVLLTAIGGFQARERLVAGPAYQNDATHHLLWDSILTGLVIYDSGLFQQYTGLTAAPTDGEEGGCLAVDYYLRQSDRIGVDCTTASSALNSDAGRYDAEAFQVVLKILRERPLAVIRLFPLKLRMQVEEFQSEDAFSLARLELPGFFILLSAVIYAATGGLVATGREVARATSFGGVLVACALVDPIVDASRMAQGTLASVMLASTMLVSCSILLPATLLARRLAARCLAAR